MATELPRPILAGKTALVAGIANEHSIAYGCARAFRELGAELAVTYLNDKARSFVEPLARELAAPLLLPLDFSKQGMLEAAGVDIVLERAVELVRFRRDLLGIEALVHDHLSEGLNALALL